MALLADGLHMGSHAVALAITAFAYAYARRHARDERFCFGTGKVNALGGFTGAVLLAFFAAYMAYESIARFLNPVQIVFDYAILVAVLGLLVNVASAFILGVKGHDHDHDHEHEHGHAAHHHHEDHNLRSAYLHVLADAVTSLAAIVALLAGKYFGQEWMDPAMGVAGSLLVARWSWGLLRQTSHVLLDRQAPAPVLDAIREAVAGNEGDEVSDLHVWSIGPGIWAAAVAVVTDDPQPVEAYKARIPERLGVVHVTIEVTRCPEDGG
jgi:cation diffusion facilitator family transporter